MIAVEVFTFFYQIEETLEQMWTIFASSTY